MTLKTFIQKPSRAEIREALEENVRLGYMVKNPNGTYSLTEAGIKHVESLRKPDAELPPHLRKH